MDEMEKRLIQLESENASLLEWQNEINKLLPQLISVLEKNGKDIELLQNYSFINRLRVESLPYELLDKDFESDVFIPRFLTVKETRNKIINEKKSIARFGDGEFGIIFGKKRWNFQSESDFLASKLREVLTCDDEDLLIGLNPNFYRNLGNLSENDADGVRAYMRPSVRKKHAELLDKSKVYADALMHSIENDDDVAELKQLWDKRECVFVEGEYTRMGVGNDLFNNCLSIERILAPAENAVDKYDEIIKEVQKQPKEKLILLALGPTATALAYDLHKEGYQAVDIGHIDLIYERFLRSLPSIEDVDIPFKYCSKDELGNRRPIPDSDDTVYASQIVAKLL